VTGNQKGVVSGGWFVVHGLGAVRWRVPEQAVQCAHGIAQVPLTLFDEIFTQVAQLASQPSQTLRFCGGSHRDAQMAPTKSLRAEGIAFYDVRLDGYDCPPDLLE
jgi:hypothetical protein